MNRHQSSAADPVFRIAFFGRRAADQLDAGPDPAGVLPATTAAADPFAQNGAGGDEPAIVFGQRSGQSD